MFTNRFVRWLVGGLLGTFAGISLVLSVLPLGLQFAGIGDRTALSMALSRTVPLAGAMWAAAGLGVARLGRPLAGALTLGMVGLASGAWFTVIALGSDPKLAAIGAIAGLAYGLGAGLLLGRILEPARADAG